MDLRENLVDLEGKIVVITGAANEIVRAWATKFTAKGAGKIIYADIDLERVCDTAKRITGIVQKVAVVQESGISASIEKPETNIGPINLFAQIQVFCLSVK